MNENLLLFLLMLIFPTWLWLRQPVRDLIAKSKEQGKYYRIKSMSDDEVMRNGVEKFNEGALALGNEDWKNAAEFFIESILCLRQTSDFTKLIEACYGMAVAQRAQGNIDEARRYYTEARICANRVKDKEQEIKVLMAMAQLEADQKAYPYARSGYLQAIKLIQQVGILEQEASAFIKLADMELEAGKPDRAMTYLEVAARIANIIGNDTLQANCMLRSSDIQRSAMKSAAPAAS